MTPIDVQVTRSKVKVKLLIFIPSVIYSISYDPLHDGYQSCYTGWLREDYPYCVSGHRVKVKLLVLSAQYFMKHLLDHYQACCKVVATREWIIHCITFATFLNFAPAATFLVYINTALYIETLSLFTAVVHRMINIGYF